MLAAVLVLSVMWIACDILEPPPGTLWRQNMTPLEIEVVEDLCDKFELPANQEPCNATRKLYTIDFWFSIRNYSKPFESTTYGDVQEKMGEYQLMCESPVTRSDGSSYFRCRYTLTGSEVDLFGIKYSGDGVLEEIFFPID